MSYATPQEMLDALTQALWGNNYPDNVQQVTKATEVWAPDYDRPDGVDLEVEYVKTDGTSGHVCLTGVSLEDVLNGRGYAVPPHRLTWTLTRQEETA